jgi:uncharacterized protein YjbI with pentapeptide repeats
MAGPEPKSTDALPYPIWGFDPPSPEPDTKKLDALLASLNGSAERFQTLWFSFLGLTLYLAIAALATTHRDLLLNNPQTLPILNIKVELLPFYVIAPLLYLVFHFYLLMMLLLLARTAAEFDKQLRTTLPGEPERERYRAQVGNALFLQLLVGMKGERTGVNALLMGLIALITIVLAPLATLVLMQMMFLPYHHLRITWWHRGVVAADLVLILVMTYRCFFPRGVTKAPLVLGALGRKPRWATAMAFCLLLAVCLFPLAYWLSFREGRWAGEPRLSLSEWRWWAGATPPLAGVDPDYSATANGVVFGWFPDRLKLNDESVVGQEKLDKTKEETASRGGTDFVPTLKLDGRDLQAADLSGADLRGVSLNGAVMLSANLEGARLDGARISCEQQGGSLVCAQLQGASLSRTRLQGADLNRARLQGSNLNQAQLQGAKLGFARLQGADLRQAQLQGADLSEPYLEGANLSEAYLQGAHLYKAQLQGASLYNAQLQGAELWYAQLQGADLFGTDLSDSELRNCFVFGADIGYASLGSAAIRSVEPGRDKHDKHFRTVPLVYADLDGWIAAATEFAREGDKAEIIQRFARLKELLATEQDASDQAAWIELTKQSSALDDTRRRLGLADRLGKLACDPDGAPYVARGLISWSRLAALGDQLDGVRNQMKAGRDKPGACKGVVGFTDDDWRRLEAIKPIVAAPANR